MEDQLQLNKISLPFSKTLSHDALSDQKQGMMPDVI
jgi:hypothetical protein